MTTSTQVAPITSEISAAAAEKAIVHGNLDDLAPADRVAYYGTLCRSLGLNPLTRPFQYLKLSGRLTLYATRDATDQLRALHGISVTRLDREHRDGLAVVTAHAADRNGRTDASTGVVSTAGLKGEALANALMKAETKAKRRVTLSLAGAGFLDETEVGSVPTAETVVVDHDTGEVLDPEPPPEPALFDGRGSIEAAAAEFGLSDDDAKRVARGAGIRTVKDLRDREKVALAVEAIRQAAGSVGPSGESATLDAAWDAGAAGSAPGVDAP